MCVCPLEVERGGERVEDQGNPLARGFFFFFLSSNFYPGWHPYGQAGWLSTTQVLKGSLLLNPVDIEKEKKG